MDTTYTSEYKQKLTTPQKAVEMIVYGDTVIPGMSFAEPPALLKAIADRVRGEELKDIKFYFMNPTSHAAESVLAPDLADCIQVYSLFVGSSDRAMVKVGLSYFVPNYFHQIPRLVHFPIM